MRVNCHSTKEPLRQTWSRLCLTTASRNPVNWITGELSFGNFWKLQKKLTVNFKVIQIPRRKIGHTALIYNIPAYVTFNPFLCTPPNNGVNSGFIVQYSVGSTYQRNWRQVWQNGRIRQSYLKKTTNIAVDEK